MCLFIIDILKEIKTNYYNRSQTSPPKDLQTNKEKITDQFEWNVFVLHKYNY